MLACLVELVKIMECRKDMGQIVLPIFYHVDPSHVREQRGSFGEAFPKYGKDSKEEKVQRCRTALTESASIAGEAVNDGYESEYIKKITEYVFIRLNHKLLHVEKNLIGMDSHLNEMISQLCIEANEVRMVGIYGCGGIGKTTIVKLVYNKISHHYENISFLANVREASADHHGLLKLQKQLLDDILVGGNHTISNLDQGKRMIENNLSFKRVLIILDDVDHGRQLESLVGSKDWFGLGSRIIITTRNKHLLVIHGVNKLYPVKKLNSMKALELFSQHAFKQNYPKEGYTFLSNGIVRYVDGLPLALKILGSFLFDKTILEWESELCKLEKIPNMEIHAVLKISFDGLDSLQKEIFLDIACFFKGQHKDFVSRILDGCNFYASSGIRVLSDMCLITILDDKIHMHDLIQQMGWKIVRAKCHENHYKWSRLWDPEDICSASTREKVMKKIEAIALDLSKLKELQINSKDTLMKMKKLRLLKVYCSDYDGFVKKKYKVHLPKDFKFHSHALRYLHWQGYSLKSLPSNFYGDNLVDLNLEDSEIKQLWQGNKYLGKLKVLNLSRSKQLIEIQNFSNMPNLEEIYLENCRSMEKIDPSVGVLKELTRLNLSGCEKLRSLPGSIQCLDYLQCIDLNECSSLEKFPEMIHLGKTAIKELPSSIEHLNLLRHLFIGGCSNLRSLPSSICRLKSLQRLYLNGCSKMETFPNITEDMESLLVLDLKGTAIKELPSSIRHLKHLEVLKLNNCKNLVTLPNSICNLSFIYDLSVNGCSKLEKFPDNQGNLEGLCSLSFLDLGGCNLEKLIYDTCCLCSLMYLSLSPSDILSIPAGISQLCKLRMLGISHCKMLQKIPELPSSLRSIDAHGCTGLESLASEKSQLWSTLLNWFKSATQDVELWTCDNKYHEGFFEISIPGSSGIPGWVSLQEMGDEVGIELPVGWHEDDHFLGFVFFYLIHNEGATTHDYGFFFKLSGDSYEVVRCPFFRSHCHEYHKCYMINNGLSNELLVIYYPKILIPNKYHSNQSLLFKVSPYALYRAHPKASRSGVHLIYNRDDNDQQIHEVNKLLHSSVGAYGCQQDDEHNKHMANDEEKYVQELGLSWEFW